MLLGCKRDGRPSWGTQGVGWGHVRRLRHQRRGVWVEGASGDR